LARHAPEEGSGPAPATRDDQWRLTWGANHETSAAAGFVCAHTADSDLQRLASAEAEIAADLSATPTFEKPRVLFPPCAPKAMI